MKPKIYIDTSVFGGYYDSEFEEFTRPLFERIRNKEFNVIYSSVTEEELDILVSWNFKHIVNVDRIKAYNSVNLKMGYAIIDIRSPRELIKYEE